MQPIRIRYHDPTSPEVTVVRYNDPLVKQHRHLVDENRHEKHEHRSQKRQHRLRENKSDFDYDYGPSRKDFEHMRHSVPEKYWGPYNPRLYDRKRHWDDVEDDKYYDFKFDSYRKRGAGDGYRGEYNPEYLPPQEERRHHEDFDRPGYEPVDRYDRRPVRHSYEPRYERLYRGPGRPDYYRRPEVVQSEVILPRNRLRPIHYVEEPRRHLYELRQVPQEPVIRRGYDDEQIHYPTYRSEVSDRYLVSYPQFEEPLEPKVALVPIPRPVKHHVGYVGAPPERSSKFLPHMHYDELRCPNCKDKVRSNYPEVLAYPWTVQTYPGWIPLSTAKASVITPSIRTGTEQVGAGAEKSAVSKTNAKNNAAAVDKPGDKNASNDDKNRTKTANQTKSKTTGNPQKETPVKPETKGKENKDKKSNDTKAGELKDNNNSKKPLSERGNKPSDSKGKTTANQKKENLDTVHESPDENVDKDVVDDIRPQDSVSNVDAQPLRPYPRDQNNKEHRRFYQARAQAISPVSRYSYPSGRYFSRLEYIPPARRTPPLIYARHPDYIPARRERESPVLMWDRPTHRSRHLHGRYYDRQDGRIYDYDVNYDGNQIYSDRRLLLR